MSAINGRMAVVSASVGSASAGVIGSFSMGRGPDPVDRVSFSASHLAVLKHGVADLSWLLSQGYAEPGSLKLVGDRYQLLARRRPAVRRSVCADQALTARLVRRCKLGDSRENVLALDGSNALIVVESALSGDAAVLDGCGAWIDLPASVLAAHAREPWVVDLRIGQS